MNTPVHRFKPRLRNIGKAMSAKYESFGCSAWALPVVLLLLSGAPVFSQSFEWVNQPLAATPFGGDEEGRAIAKDASGNIYVTGFFSGSADFDPGAGVANLSSAGFQDIFIAKYDASGNYVWARQVGSTSEDIGNGIAIDGSGNAYVTGSFVGIADFDPGAGTANLGNPDDQNIFR